MAVFVLYSVLAASSLLPAKDYRVFDEETLFYRLRYKERIRYNGLQYLFNDHQKKQYLSLETWDERDEWLRCFWLEMDPTPTTKHNERRKEHIDRVKLAVDKYGCDDPPGWDDRGEILIRFGLPDKIKRVWAMVNRLEQRWPGEIWYYQSPPMLVAFTDPHLSGKYICSTDAAGQESWTEDYYAGNFGKSSRMILEDLANIYHPNTSTADAITVPSFSPTQPQGYDRMTDLSKKGGKAVRYRERINTDLATLMYHTDNSLGRSAIITSFLPSYLDPDLSDSRNSLNPDAIDYVHYWEIARNPLMDITFRNVTDEYVKSDKALYEFHHQIKSTRFIHYPGFDFDMNAYFDITSFHSGTEKLRTEVNFEIPVTEITFDTTGSMLEGEVELRVIVRDLDQKEITADEKILRISVPNTKNAKVPSYLPGQVLLTLEPGYYRFGLETIDRNSGSRGVFRTNRWLNCGPGLSISDIQFARMISEGDQNSRYRKGALIVIPYPLHLYRKSFPISFYFEIYGLDIDKEDFGFYSVEYTVTPTEKKRWGLVLVDQDTGISASFNASGFGSTQPHRLVINTDNLWSGRFVLRVKVTDRRTRKSTEQTASFAILD
jgi:GWxTD domain-containing protein